MYRGVNSTSAHSGAHVNFIDNSDETVCRISINLTNYPTIHIMHNE